MSLSVAGLLSKCHIQVATLLRLLTSRSPAKAPPPLDVMALLTEFIVETRANDMKHADDIAKLSTMTKLQNKKFSAIQGTISKNAGKISSNAAKISSNTRSISSVSGKAKRNTDDIAQIKRGSHLRRKYS